MILQIYTSTKKTSNSHIYFYFNSHNLMWFNVPLALFWPLLENPKKSEAD